MANVKILQEIHPLNIIREVQKWPALYAKDSPERTNLHFKNKIWREVAKALFSDWESLSNKEKEQKVNDLTKKWRHLRDTFKRQLAVERKVREGDQSAKKKTYVYFKHMLYLLPHVNTPETESSDPILETKLSEYFDKQKKKGNKKGKKLAKKPNIASASTDPIIEDIDEDKHFLMSLIPSFKRMTDDEKLTAKLEILKVIKDVKTKSSECSAPLVDSLGSVEEANIEYDIKVEMLQETDQGQWNESDYSDHGMSD